MTECACRCGCRGLRRAEDSPRRSGRCGRSGSGTMQRIRSGTSARTFDLSVQSSGSPVGIIMSGSTGVAAATGSATRRRASSTRRTPERPAAATTAAATTAAARRSRRWTAERASPASLRRTAISAAPSGGARGLASGRRGRFRAGSPLGARASGWRLCCAARRRRGPSATARRTPSRG